MSRVYAIGDVHGQLDELARAHARIAADRAAHAGWGEAPVIHLGDLVDRGPESAAVIEYLLMGPVADGAPWIALRGNHDWLALLWLIDPDAAAGTDRPAAAWLLPGFGGRATLESYGIEGAAEAEGPELWAEARARVPPAHLAYLAALPLWHATPEAVFVHAGLRPGVPLERQSPADILWIRRGFVDVAHDHGRLVVHGHTPLDEPRHFGTRVDLDAGAGYGRPLVAAAVEGRRVWILTEDGRHELTPP